jgi:N-formylglutamate deformylase
MDDQTFLRQFERCELDAAHFAHAGHLRLAWLYLQRYPFAEAVERTCSGIARYAAHLGAAGKFHRTVTQALLHLMRAGGACDRALGWPDFLAANPGLRDDARGCVARHYSVGLLASDAARTQFLQPDLAPLPDA